MARPLRDVDCVLQEEKRKGVAAGDPGEVGLLFAWRGKAGKGEISFSRTNDLVTRDAGDSATKFQVRGEADCDNSQKLNVSRCCCEQRYSRAEFAKYI
jgi:hypothetical protein